MRTEQAFYSIIETAMPRTPALPPDLMPQSITLHTRERDGDGAFSESGRLV